MSPPTVTSQVSPADVPHTSGNFDLIKRVKLDFTDVTVSKWRSRVTGLTVVHLDYNGELHIGSSCDLYTDTSFSPNREWLLRCWYRK